MDKGKVHPRPSTEEKTREEEAILKDVCGRQDKPTGVEST